MSLPTTAEIETEMRCLHCAIVAAIQAYYGDENPNSDSVFPEDLDLSETIQALQQITAELCHSAESEIETQKALQYAHGALDHFSTAIAELDAQDESTTATKQ